MLKLSQQRRFRKPPTGQLPEWETPKNWGVLRKQNMHQGASTMGIESTAKQLAKCSQVIPTNSHVPGHKRGRGRPERFYRGNLAHPCPKSIAPEYEAKRRAQRKADAERLLQKCLRERGHHKFPSLRRKLRNMDTEVYRRLQILCGIR